MTLDPQTRAEIYRQNARRSTGPTSSRGKEIARRNALKHGLRAEALAMPNEDPDEVRARDDAWNDHYRPQSPAAQHLVNQCVHATLLADRCRRHHDAAVAAQVRDAEQRFDHRSEDEADALEALLETDPAAAVARLKRTAPGCRRLIDRWERLGRQFEENGRWFGPERDEVTRLISRRPEPDRLVKDEAAWLTRFYNLLCREAPSAQAVAWLLDPARMPESLRGTVDPDELPGRDEASSSLREMVAGNLKRLREQEEKLREAYDADRAGASDRALVLEDGPSARLFLRYHAEARTSFHRAYGALLKTLASDADASDPPQPQTATELEPTPPADPGAPAVSPNEAVCGTVPEPTSPDAEAFSPNEAVSDGGSGAPPVSPRASGTVSRALDRPSVEPFAPISTA